MSAREVGRGQKAPSFASFADQTPSAGFMLRAVRSHWKVLKRREVCSMFLKDHSGECIVGGQE